MHYEQVYCKYFDLKNFHMRGSIQLGWLTFVYCPTNEMTADILTKALPRQPHMLHTKGLGLRSA